MFVATELTELEINHMAGVDAPANSVPGWMVMKEGTEVQAAEAQLAAIYATLGGASVLEGAPEEVRKAAQDLATYVEKQLSAPEPEPSLIEKMKALFKAQPKPQNPDEGASDEEDGGALGQKPNMKKKVKKDKKLVAPADGDDDPAAKESRDVQKELVTKAVSTMVEKELAPVVESVMELRKQYDQDSEVLRDALVKALDRIEYLENEIIGSYQPTGQESVEKSVTAGSLEAGVLSAFMGNRVTLR